MIVAISERFASTSLGEQVLNAERVTKSFVGRTVLRDANLTIRGGDIHALLGANGSGKSTFVKILAGVYQADGGSITVGDRKLATIASPHQASELGVAVVHQEAPLIQSLSIAECIAQFRGYPTKGSRILWNKLHKDVADLLERFELKVSPRQLAGKLSAAERALVAIVIALDKIGSGIKLLILDEVTASLPQNQAEPYLDRVAALARSGIGILMVTHRLAELRGRASNVTVLRDGLVVYAAPAGEVDDARLVHEMTDTAAAASSPLVSVDRGRENPLTRLWTMRKRRATPALARNPIAIAAENLQGATLRGLSFAVRSGEIVGMGGLSESGVTELPRILAGLNQFSGGTLRINGAPIQSPATPRSMIQAGAVVLPADRLHMGGVPTLTVTENVVLPDCNQYWMRRRQESKVIDKVIEAFDIRPPLASTLFAKLSGGNQQKTILAKWLLLEPYLLVLDDPTNGVDPAARQKIFERLRDAAAEGVGVLVFSTEPEQFVNVCSRVLVLRNGVVVQELAGPNLNRQAISQWCYA